MKQSPRKSILFSAVAFLTLGLGISLQIKAGVGQSMFNAFSLTVSEPLGIEVGTMINGLNLLFFLLYFFLRRSRLNHRDLIQLAAIIANGFVINFFVYSVFSSFTLQIYALRMLVFILGLCLSSVSLGAILAIGIVKFPLESLCIELGNRLGISLSNIRMRFDVGFLLGTLILTAVLGTTLHIREGTLVSFFLLSRLMGYSYDYWVAS
jgi:uncharacterized membrane protein YczE